LNLIYNIKIANGVVDSVIGSPVFNGNVTEKSGIAKSCQKLNQELEKNLVGTHFAPRN
jgi:hypothetical protein